MREAIEAAGARPLVIAAALDAQQNAYLSDHPSRPRVIRYSDGHAVWDVPLEADVLMTYFRGWNRAPPTPPAGWPFNLKWIQAASSGMDAFPKWFFDGPVVTCARGFAAASIAEFAMAAVLAHEKGLFDGVLIHAADQWVKHNLGGVEGKTIGLAGFGAIGKSIAVRAKAFGMHIVALRRSEGSDEDGVEFVRTAADLAAASDHLVLALPLTQGTRRLVDSTVFAAAKPGLHLINISRGPVVDHAALIDALNSGRLSAATLDVTDPEPLPAGHPLYTHPRIRLTPHVSFLTPETGHRLALTLRANLDRFVRGETLKDIVDYERGY